MTGQHPSVPYPAPSTMPPESLHPGPNVCSLPYDGRFLGSAYPRLSEIYAGAGYSDPVTASYMSGLATSHPAMLYPTTLTSPYDLKDPRAAWATLPQAAGYPCDPSFAAYGPYGDRFDPVDSEARRRNATRETTSTLKAWLNEHRKNPYPTKGEKIMLAIITKMTLTQVSTWFANARRRLKKENKMTWEPRNKTGDDLDDVSVDEDEDKDDDDQKSNHSEPERKDTQSEKKEEDVPSDNVSEKSTSTLASKDSENHPAKKAVTDIPQRPKSEDPVSTAEKPKIWSLAQTATSQSPPTSRKHPLDHQHHEDFKRMRRMVYPESLHPADFSHPSHYHRGMPRLHPDSSTESSLSSPPLWRTSDIHPLSHGDKYGRVTPLDSSDIVSMSPSSSGSPVLVSSSLDQRNNLSPSMSYNRLLGSRLFPCGDVSSSGLRPNSMDHSHFYTTQASSMPPTLDLRTLHSAFLKSSQFGYPVGFTTSSSHIPPSLSSTTVSKPKPVEGSHQRSES